MNVAVPLISAAIAGLVAWIVARHQGRTAHENWVRDKRYGLYEAAIVAIDEHLLSGGQAVDGADLGAEIRGALQDPDVREPITSALIRMQVIGPSKVNAEAVHLHQLLLDVADGVQDSNALMDGLHGFVDLLRTDLLPKHMR